jgi:hypothetical protein
LVTRLKTCNNKQKMTSTCECEHDKVYALVSERPCDDPYYPPYHDVIAVFHSLERAMESTRQRAAKAYDPEYPNELVVYFVEEYTLADETGSSYTKVVFQMVGLQEEEIK